MAARKAAAERWTATTHVEQLSDGTHRLEVFTQPTFRRGADGWESLHGRIEQRRGKPFAPGSSRPLTFGSTAGDVVTMDLGSGPVTLSTPGLDVTRPSIDGSSVLYKDVAADTDLRFTVMPDGFREEYLLTSADAPMSYTTTIADPEHRLGEPVRQDDGGYVFSTVFPDGLQMRIAGAYAYEELVGPTSADSSAATLQVTVTPQGYDVTKGLDAEWASQATFPVVLDPTVVWQPDLGRGYAADGWAPWCNTIFSNPEAPFYNNDATLRSGVTSSGSGGWSAAGTRAFLAIEVSLPPGTRILDAQLDLAWYADAPGRGPFSRYEILEYLEQRDTVQNGCRLTKGASARTGSISTAIDANWNISALVQKWVNTPASNNGLIIAPADISSHTSEDRWSSSRGPRLPALIIQYADPQLPFVDLANDQITGTPSACTTADPSMYRADPVNTQTGRLVEAIVDIDLQSEALPLQLRRSYDSSSTQAGALGWTHGLETRLTYDAGTGYAVVDTGAGNKIGFARQPDGSFLPDVGVTAELASTSDGYVLSMPCSGASFRFGSTGLLQSITGNDSGFQLTAAHNSAGELSTVTDSDGKSLTFTHVAGRVDRVTLQDGRFVQYGYTGGRLTSVRALDGVTATYRYDAAGNLDQMSTADRTVTNVFDQATGRLLSQKDGEGNTTTFAWDPATSTARTTYPGGGVATDVYSGDFLIRTTDRSGAMVQFTYNGDGRVATVTDPMARVTTMSYDPVTGLLAERIGPGPQHYREAWTYDAEGHVLTSTDRDGKVTTHTYDAAGRMDSVRDPLGRTATYTYDAQGRVLSITDPRAEAPGANPAQFRTTFTYDVNGYPRTTTDPLGRVSTTTHDAQGRLVSVTDAEGGTASFAYTALGQPLTATDPRGNVPGAVAAHHTTTNTYNVHGEVETTTDAAGGTTRYTYDRAGRITAVTNPLQRTTTYAYDADGNVTKVTDATGAVTTYTYSAGGRLTSMTTPRGNALPATERAPHTWTYTYDAIGNQTKVSNPLTGPVVKTYDAYGRLVSTSTPYQSSSNGYDEVYESFTTRTSYDGRGNVVSETDQYGAVTTYTYDDAGQLIASTSPRGNVTGADAAAHTTRYEYDLAGLRTAVIDPLGNKTTSTYDAAGQLVATTDPRGNVTGSTPATYTTTYGYDRAGRQTTVTDPLGAKTTQKYDPAGNLIATTDPRGNVTGATAATTASYTTSYVLDRLDRVVTETAPGGGVTRFTYDAVGNPLTRTDANNHTTRYTYDAADRQLTRTSATGQVWRTTYDPNGQVVTQTNPAGSATTTTGDGTTTYQRDPLGRGTLLDYSDATPDVTYTYMVDGRPKSATTSGGVATTYRYADWSQAAPGSLYSITTGGDADAIFYTHDALGHLVQRQSYEAGVSKTVDYTYDALDRVASVGTGAAVVRLGYDRIGNLASITHPSTNGYVETRSYDPVGRIAAVANKRGTATLSAYTQTYDPASNPSTLTIVNGGTTTQTAYTYDPAGRLTKACYASTCAAATAHLTYTYDPAGNRKSEVRTGVTTPGTTTYAYDDADQLLSTTTGSTTTRYTYDPNGNQTAAGTRTSTYDLANRVKTTTSGSTTTAYTYDANGNRRMQTVGSTVTGYTWDLAHGLPQLAHETGAKNAVTARYTHTPSGMPLTLTTAAGAFYYHHDPLGSISNLTNATGATQASYTYEPFGAQRTAVLASKAPANRMRFAGQYLDTTGLYNLRARLYNPTIGQFTALDPLVDVTNEPYAYGSNNPLRYTDPSGLASEDWVDAAKGWHDGYMDVADAIVYGPIRFASHPVREWDRTMVKPCNDGFDQYSHRFHGFLKCVDNLNPIAQIGRGLKTSVDYAASGCWYDAGRALAPPAGPSRRYRC